MLREAVARTQLMGLAQLKIDFASDALDPDGTSSGGISRPVASLSPQSHLRSLVTIRPSPGAYWRLELTGLGDSGKSKKIAHFTGVSRSPLSSLQLSLDSHFIICH